MTAQTQTRYPVYERNSDLLLDVVECILDRRGIPNTAIGPARDTGLVVSLGWRDRDNISTEEFDSMCKELRATARGLGYGYEATGPEQGVYSIRIKRSQQGRRK